MSLINWNKDNILKFSIDYTKVDSPLDNFPILLNITTDSALNNYDCSDIFTTLSGYSNKKIAIVYPSVQEHYVTISGISVLKTYVHGEQEQLYCEIERWDTANKSAQLWVKVPKILNDQPTDIFLYYDENQEDNTKYIGNTTSAPAQKVWDDNFIFVYHMSQDPSGGANSILDSTANARHGTSHTGMTANNIVDGQVGKALEFSGSDNQVYRYLYFSVPKFTIESIHYIYTGSSDDMVISNCNYLGLDKDFQTYINSHKQNCKISSVIVPNKILNEDEHWYFNAATYDTNTFKYYNNGILRQTINSSNTSTTTSYPWIIGSDADRSTGIGTGNFLHGRINEVRLSNIPRSDTWVNVTYYSNFDMLCEITKAELYGFSGYVKELGQPVQRVLYLYDRTSGELIDKTMSDSSTGYYLLKTTSSGIHNIVCLDAEALPDFDDLLNSKVTPMEII